MLETYTQPTVCYSLFPLELKQDDRHRMQEDSSHVPLPQIYPNSQSTFILPAATAVLCVNTRGTCHPMSCIDKTYSYFRLLPGARCLLITRDHAGDCRIYMSSIATLQDAVCKRPTKELKRDKIGENIFFSYDESKRTLAICSVSGVKFDQFRLSKTLD